MGRPGGSGSEWRGLPPVVGLLLVAVPGSVAGQGVDALGTPSGPGVESQAPADASTDDADGRPSSYEAEWLAVVEPSLIGVDPVIAEPVVQRLSEVGSSLGYRLRDGGGVAQAVERVGLGRIVSPADLWRVTYLSGAQASVHVRVWAKDGQYVLELTVALLDGRGPFTRSRTSDHRAFLDTLEAMVRAALPAAGTGTPTYPPPTAPRRPPPGLAAEAFEPAGSDQPAAPPPPLRRIGLALSTEPAFGLGEAGFYNYLVGGRLDVRLTHEVVLGAYAGYGNLAGYQGRAHNLLTYLQIENRIRVSDRSKLRIPLRFGAGYVPSNGPVLRMAVGIAYPVSDRFEWGLDLLTPMIWFLPEGQVATSLNLGVEIIFNP